MTRLGDIKTPALILDRKILNRNLEAMSRRMSGLGVSLRPHLKTAKSATIAGLATKDHAGGITVSTLREAAYFAERGFRDLTYAVGISPQKLDEVAGLQRNGAAIRVLTDDTGVARRISERGEELGVRFKVLIEVDSGAHRGGVAPDSPELIEIARNLGSPGAGLEGVLTHAGHSYDCDGPGSVQEVAEEERRGAPQAAEALRARGFDCPVVSAGSTPTAVHAGSLEGVTEMRPGNYMFFDLFQEGLGSCERQDIAVSVLATVIGRSPRFNRILIDAGALALSLDTSANRWTPGLGYGIVLGSSGRAWDVEPRVARVHQEHGFVEAPRPLPFDELPVGARVRVLPNHACATAAMFDRYLVTNGADEIIDTWDRIQGW